VSSPPGDGGTPAVESVVDEVDREPSQAAEPSIITESANITAPGGYGFNLTTLLGSPLNRVAGLAALVVLSVLASYTTAGICKWASESDTVTTAVGLTTFAVVFFGGFCWIWLGPRMEREKQE